MGITKQHDSIENKSSAADEPMTAQDIIDARKAQKAAAMAQKSSATSTHAAKAKEDADDALASDVDASDDAEDDYAADYVDDAEADYAADYVDDTEADADDDESDSDSDDAADDQDADADANDADDNATSREDFEEQVENIVKELTISPEQLRIAEQGFAAQAALRYRQMMEPNQEFDKEEFDKRVSKSVEILLKLGLVHNEGKYQLYCVNMRQYGLEPFSYSFVLWMCTCEVFGSQGILSQKLKNYRPRPGQIKFALEVAKTIENKHILSIEAGTGTGKTFSYLVPPLLAGKRVMVSTRTKVLQDQLIKKDVPNLYSTLGIDDLTSISLKGQSNYMCRYLMDDTAQQQLPSDLKIRIGRYYDRCIDELDNNLNDAVFGELKVKMEDGYRHFVSCDSRLCAEMSKSCPYATEKREFMRDYSKFIEQHSRNGKTVSKWLDKSRPRVDSDHCFVFAARQEAKSRDVVVINHALFFGAINSITEIGEPGNLLPLPDVLVFDEAHTLAEVGREFFKRELSSDGLSDLVQKASALLDASTLAQYKGEAEKAIYKIANCRLILERAFKLVYSVDQSSSYNQNTEQNPFANATSRFSISNFKYKHNKVHTVMQSPFEFLGYKLIADNEYQLLGEDSNVARIVVELLKSAGLYEETDTFDDSADDSAASSVTSLLGKGSSKSADLLASLKAEEEESAAGADAAQGAAEGATDGADAADDAQGSAEKASEDKKESMGKAAMKKSTRHKLVKSLLKGSSNRDFEAQLEREYRALVKEYKETAETYGVNNFAKEYENVLFDEYGNPVKDLLFRAVMGDLHKGLTQLKAHFDDALEISDTESSSSDEDASVSSVGEDAKALIELIEEMLEIITDIMSTDRDRFGKLNFEHAGWVEMSDNGFFKLVVCPIDIGPYLGDKLRSIAAQGTSIIFTSATITSYNSFSKFLYDIGLSENEVVTEIVESPFDYQKNAVLFTSDRFPPAGTRDRFNKFFDQIDDIVNEIEGGIFILTTSYSQLKDAFFAAKKRYGHSRKVMRQGDDTVENLMNAFKEEGNAILVGTSSFWEGVDVPGKALSLVIIDKLPFKSVGDPINQAIQSKIESDGRSSYFNKVYLPDAIITLRQGVGRLIRNETDQGVLIIMDPRLERQRYKDQVFMSLPPMKHVKTVDECLRLLREFD